jgi:hypothetical protein
MEPNISNFTNTNSYNCLYSLGLSDGCKNVLEKIYPEIQRGKELICQKQYLDQLSPYVKIGVINAADCQNTIVKMQVISAKSYISQRVNDYAGIGCNKLNYWAPIVNRSLFHISNTSLDLTELALRTTRCKISEEIPSKVKTWMETVHTENENDDMVADLQILQLEIWKVNYVVQCVIQTYREKEPVDTLEGEKQHLNDFAEQINGLISLFPNSKEKRCLPVHKTIENKNEVVEEKVIKKSVPLRKVEDELKFESMEQANKWFTGRLEFAVGNSKISNKLYDDLTTFPMFFYKFADEIDALFHVKRKDNNFELLSAYLKDIVKNLVEGIDSDDSKNEGLAAPLKEVRNFRDLFQRLLERTGRNEDDFHKLFRILVNKAENGPADMENAPIVLLKIFNKLEFFNLFYSPKT